MRPLPRLLWPRGTLCETNFAGLCNAIHVRSDILHNCIRTPVRITAPSIVFWRAEMKGYHGAVLHQAL
jgi:hypothetical protein